MQLFSIGVATKSKNCPHSSDQHSPTLKVVAAAGVAASAGEGAVDIGDVAGAEAVRRSDGRALPVLFSTKNTYGHSLAKNWAGFVECDTTAKLIALAAAHPSVVGWIWWFYPDGEKDQPSVAAITAWFDKCRPVPAACLHHADAPDDGG